MTSCTKSNVNVYKDIHYAASYYDFIVIPY